MLQQGRGQTLREWVERLPAPTRERDPWIDYWYGTSLVPLDQPAARSALEPVFDRFTQAGDIAGKALSAAGITETYHFEWSRFRPLDRWITVLDEALQLGTKFSALESELRVCAAFLIAAARREPWHPSLPSRLARVLELLEEPLDPDQRVAAGTIVMSYCVHVADHDTACRAISIISPLLDEPSITAMNRIFWYTRLMTVLLRLRVSDEEASIAASKALTLAKEHNLKHVMPWVYYGQHELLAFKSNVSLLVANAQLIESNLVATRLVDQFLWRVVWVYIELTRGDAGAAHKHAEIAIQLADETGAVLLQGFARKHMAFAYVHAGNWIQAAGCIEEGRRILGSALFPYVTVQYDLLEAYIALRSNGAQHARDLLRGALASPVIFGVAKELLLCGPTVLQALCVEALAADIESDTVKGLIRAFWLMPPVRHCHEWPWRIEIQALGPLQITQDGVALSRKGRSPTRLLQLLKLLLSSGGQPLSSSMVACELWPELEGDAAERNLDTVLHRLRRLLNCDDAIVLEDGKVRLDWRYCWVDAWAFADLAEGCLGLSPPDVVVRAKCALELYRGHFLEQDAEYPYAIGYRDRLRHLFARLVELAGGVLEQAGALSDANELYRRALALDPLTESIYRRLMLNLQKRGEATAALQVYRRCCEALSSGLGISPSLQTQSIASSLKRSDQPAL